MVVVRRESDGGGCGNAYERSDGYLKKRPKLDKKR